LLTPGKIAADLGYRLAGFVSDEVAGFLRNPQVTAMSLKGRAFVTSIWYES
jgi:hypothetical protein